MHQLDRSRLGRHGFDPVDEALLVGVGRVAGQGMHLSVDGFAFTVEMDIATGVVGIISLLLHRWAVSAGAGAAFVAFGGVLFLTWYRNLQAPDAAAEQAGEQLEP